MTTLPAIILRQRHGRYDVAVIYTGLSDYYRAHLKGGPIALKPEDRCKSLDELGRIYFPAQFAPSTAAPADAQDA